MNLTQEQRWAMSPYFDQEGPQVPITGTIADSDFSEPYELQAIGVFKTVGRGYLVVAVESCSCWPDMGGTEQWHLLRREDVFQKLTELSQTSFRRFPVHELKDAIQAAGWRVQTPLPAPEVTP